MNQETKHLTDKAWVGLVITALINIIGMPLEYYVGQDIPNIPVWPTLLAFFISLIILAITVNYRRHLTLNKIALLYIVNTGVVAVSHLVRSPFYALFVDNWVPFQTSKLGCVVVAMTAPSLFIGSVGILLHLGCTIAAFFLLPESIKLQLGFAEPVPTIAFAMVSFFVLIYRTRQMTFEMELRRSLAKEASMKSLTEAFVQLRDLMNTPLQTIELSVALLHDQTKNQKETLGKIQNALNKLVTLNKILTRYEKKIDWQRESNFFKLGDDK